MTKRDLSKENWGPLQCSNYEGNLVYKKGDGFIMWGRYLNSQQEIDDLLKEARENFAKSITINNTGTISCTNEEG